eukprot:GHUV01050057.1.p1 GENE.GHUV01050057.1~~GHUV01050057.1.p1  ORF type:complete len:104 (-),score=4.25 GHUV01050057.1:20-331(-)
MKHGPGSTISCSSCVTPNSRVLPSRECLHDCAIPTVSHCYRFGHGGPDYLSMHYDMKRPVYVQSTWLKNKDIMDKYPMRWGWVQDLLEEMTLCKYGGRPHWVG